MKQSLQAQARVAADGQTQVRILGPDPVRFGPAPRGDAMRQLAGIATQRGTAIRLETAMHHGGREEALFRPDGTVARRQVAPPRPTQPPVVRPAQMRLPQREPAAPRVLPDKVQPPPPPEEVPDAQPIREERYSFRQLTPTESWNRPLAFDPTVDVRTLISPHESNVWIFPELSRQVVIGAVGGVLILVAGIVLASILSLGQARADPSEQEPKRPVESERVYHFEGATSDE